MTLIMRMANTDRLMCAFEGCLEHVGHCAYECKPDAHAGTHAHTQNRDNKVVMSARIVKVSFSDPSGFASTPVDFEVTETQGDKETVLEITVVAVKVAADPNAIISVDAEYDWNTDGRRNGAKKMMNETLPSLRRANNETGPEMAVRRVMVAFKEKKDGDNSTKDLLVGVLLLLGVVSFVYLGQVIYKYWRNTAKAQSPIEERPGEGPAPHDLEISIHPVRLHADLVNLEITVPQAGAELRRHLHALNQDGEDA